jgi:hypothetical protein
LADCILNRMTNRERLDCMAGWLHLIRCVNIILFFLWIHFLGTFEKFDWYLIMVVLRPKNRKRDLALFFTVWLRLHRKPHFGHYSIGVLPMTPMSMKE